MTYDGLQKSLGTTAVFSAPSPLVNWDGDWNDETFFPDSLLDEVMQDDEINVVFDSLDDMYDAWINKPTIRKIMQFMDRAMKVTNDYRHIYFEGIEKIADRTYRIIAGS